MRKFEIMRRKEKDGGDDDDDDDDDDVINVSISVRLTGHISLRISAVIITHSFSQPFICSTKNERSRPSANPLTCTKLQVYIEEKENDKQEK
jgi:hypothetical protein